MREYQHVTFIYIYTYECLYPVFKDISILLYIFQAISSGKSKTRTLDPPVSNVGRFIPATPSTISVARGTPPASCGFHGCPVPKGKRGESKPPAFCPNRRIENHQILDLRNLNNKTTKNLYDAVVRKTSALLS